MGSDPEVQECKLTCYDDQFACTYGCPCYQDCPHGCPCDSYPNCPGDESFTTTRSTTTTTTWWPTSSTTMETTTIVAKTKCEEFSGQFIGIEQRCVNFVNSGGRTVASNTRLGSTGNIGKEFMFTVEVYLDKYPVNSCASIFYVGHSTNTYFPCEYEWNCLPQFRICENDNYWDRNYGIWVDFAGSSYTYSRGYRKIPLKTWTRLTFFRKQSSSNSLWFGFHYYNQYQNLEYNSDLDSRGYTYNSGNTRVWVSNYYTSSSSYNCYKSNYCFPPINGKVRNLYFSDITG